MGQVAVISALSAVRLGGSGCASSGVTVIQPARFRPIRTRAFVGRPASRVCSAWRISA